MSTVNLVVVMGRLTRDPEEKIFPNGGKVAKIGLAIAESRRKNQQTGKWEDVPCFIEVKAFNSEKRKLADTLMQFSKGERIHIVGRLTLERWQQDGQNRQRVGIIADDIKFIEPKRQEREGRQATGSQQEVSPEWSADEIPF